MSGSQKITEVTGPPPKVFLYTLDQVAYCLDMTIETLKGSYIYFQGRTQGTGRKHFIVARDISMPDARSPEWRVAEPELLRWMLLKGFRFKDGRKFID